MQTEYFGNAKPVLVNKKIFRKLDNFLNTMNNNKSSNSKLLSSISESIESNILPLFLLFIIIIVLLAKYYLKRTKMNDNRKNNARIYKNIPICKNSVSNRKTTPITNTSANKSFTKKLSANNPALTNKVFNNNNNNECYITYYIT